MSHPEIPDIFRTIHFTEQERSEQDTIAHAIATRRTHEQSINSTQLAESMGITNQAVPDFFQEAITDATAVYISRVIQTGNLPMDDTHPITSMISTISDGDWTEFLNRNLDELDGYSPHQVKNLMRMYLLTLESSNIISHPTADTDLAHIPRMLSSATDIAQSLNISTDNVYSDDELYKELIRTAFHPKEYSEYWKEVAKKSQEGYVPTLARFSLIVTNTLKSSFENPVEPPTEEEVQRVVSLVEGDPKLRKKASEEIEEMQTASDAILYAWLKRFWDSDTAKKYYK